MGMSAPCDAWHMSPDDQNSRRTRIQPVFGWLSEHADDHWPRRMLRLVDGVDAAIEPGHLVRLDYLQERQVSPSARRLAWMIRNAERLTPRDGRRWRDYQTRVVENPRRASALETLDRGETNGLDAKLILEGPTSADCLIECDRTVIWVEGKRNDWLDYSTSWDVTRDQLARNAEAAWLYAAALGKDSYLIVCHEHQLKHHEELLLQGYRSGTWAAGWPHLTPRERRMLGGRIGTLTWRSFAEQWPAIGEVLR
jgi:hypothetical protein